MEKLKFPLHRPPLVPWWRKVLHVIVLIIGWLIYLLFLRKLAQYPRESIIFVLILLACFIAIIPTITLFWIFHNLSIFKKKGHRKAVSPAKEQYDVDWNGKTISADWDRAKLSRKILITIDTTNKHYFIE